MTRRNGRTASTTETHETGSGGFLGALQVRYAIHRYEGLSKLPLLGLQRE